VVDEAQMAARTSLVIAEYETKMRQLESELAKARVTSNDFERLRIESEASQRVLRDQLAARAETERLTMSEEYEREMKHMRIELDSVRVSRDSVRAEAEDLRAKFETEMRRLEIGSTVDERIQQEKARLIEEYEQRMYRVHEELDAVKNSRLQVDEEMTRLQAKYEAQIQALQVAVIEATQTAATKQQVTDDERRKDDGEKGDSDQDVELRAVGSDDVLDNVAASTVFQLNNGQVRQTSCTDVDGDEYRTTSDEFTTLVDNSSVIPSLSVAEYRSIDDAIARRIEIDFDSWTSRMMNELEAIRQARDQLANEITVVKANYQEAIHIAQDRYGPGDLEHERRTIKADAEVQMELLKDDMDKLRSTRAIVLKQSEEKRAIRQAYDSVLETIRTLIDSHTITPDTAVLRAKSAADEYDKKCRELERRTADQKESAETRIIEAKYVGEVIAVSDAVRAGNLTEQVASELLQQLQEYKVVELKRARYKAIQSTMTPFGEDLECDKDSDHQRQQTSPDTSSESSSQQLVQILKCRRLLRPSSSSSVSPTTGDERPEVVTRGADEQKLRTSEEAARRLNELERTMIVGGSGGGGRRTPRDGLTATASADRRCTEIRERLRQEKQHAEETHSRLLREQQLMLIDDLPPTSVDQKEGGEGVCCSSGGVDQSFNARMMRTLKSLRSKNASMEREIYDIQHEFESDRIDYIDTIRKQDQTLRWYQAVLEKVVPVLRHGSNYANLERIWSQSEWDDLNQTWIMPRFTVDCSLTLPPVTPPGRCIPAMFPSKFSTPTLSSLEVSADQSLIYDLYSEERLLEKLNKSTHQDPAAAYFRTGSRAEQLINAASVGTAWTMTPYHHHHHQSARQLHQHHSLPRVESPSLSRSTSDSRPSLSAYDGRSTTNSPVGSGTPRSAGTLLPQRHKSVSSASCRRHH